MKWCYIDGNKPGSPVDLGFAAVPYEGDLPPGYVDLGEMSREEVIGAAYDLMDKRNTISDEELLGTVHRPVDESYRF